MGPDDVAMAFMVGVGFRPGLSVYPDYNELRRMGYEDDWQVSA
jgi:hypothetical protein